MVFSFLFLGFLSCLKTTVKQESSAKSLGIVFSVVPHGWLITKVEFETVAWEKGLSEGDLILSIDGSPPLFGSELRTKIARGEELTLCVLRSETELFEPSKKECQGETVVVWSSEVQADFAGDQLYLRSFEEHEWEDFQWFFLDADYPIRVVEELLSRHGVDKMCSAPISIGRYWASLMSVLIEDGEIGGAKQAAQNLLSLHDERPFFLGTHEQLQQLLVLLWEGGSKEDVIELAHRRLERLSSALPILGMAPAPPAERKRHQLPLHTNIELQLTTGETWSLEEHRGHPVVLNFFATWCVPCRYELPLLALEKERHPNIELITVSSENKSNIKSLHQAMGLELPIARGEVQSFGRFKLPYTVVIDGNGAVVWRAEGFSKNSFKRLQLELDRAVAGAGGVLFEEFFPESLFFERAYVPHSQASGVAPKGEDVWVGILKKAPQMLSEQPFYQHQVGVLEPLYSSQDRLLQVSSRLLYAYNERSELLWVRNFSTPVQQKNDVFYTQRKRFSVDGEGTIHKEESLSPTETELNRVILWEGTIQTSKAAIRLIQLKDRLVAWSEDTMWILRSHVPFQAQIVHSASQSELVIVFAQHGIVFFSPVRK